MMYGLGIPVTIARAPFRTRSRLRLRDRRADRSAVATLPLGRAPGARIGADAATSSTTRTGATSLVGSLAAATKRTGVAYDFETLSQVSITLVFGATILLAATRRPVRRR
jgi:hypothetical protein